MPTVLVVDDKPSQTELMSVMLKQLGLECIVAHTGIEAVQLAKKWLPDIIIMDWIMPADTLTGIDATRAILSEQSTNHIPVIACSAIDDMSQATCVGCVGYMRKPFGLDVLRNTIQKYL